MSLVIHLLGEPRVELDGRTQQSPRGHKAWGLLAYLLFARAPVSRAQLCALLFADADDPLAALRWNLTQLRKLIGDPGSLRGDPLQLRLDEREVDVDVRALVSGTWQEAELLGGVGRDLLGTMAFPACPSFEVWLEAERRHVRGATEALLHEGALAALAAGEAHRAADLAGRLVQLDPYDENHQALLVRALASSGDGVAAARQVAACRELYRRELGVEPGATLEAAAATVTAQPTRLATTGPAAVVALTQAGKAAITAGAVDAGLHCLRRAVADAAALRDAVLEARALTSLGSALIHAVRGRDEEGATALHQALALAADRFPDVVSEASRELGYVEFLRGRYDRVPGWLARAQAAAHGDEVQRARILTLRGSTLSDLGRYEAALSALREACLIDAGDHERSYAWSMIGRVHLLRGALDQASDALDTSITLATRSGWTAFLPWPQSLRATVDIERGDHRSARERLDRAFALGCHLGDPCWEGVAARGLGILQAAEGAVAEGLATLRDARARCMRLPDGYLWLDAYTLEAMCRLAVEHDLDEAPALVDELDRLVTRSGMNELMIRAQLHHAVLGTGPGVTALDALVKDVDNPLVMAAVRASQHAREGSGRSGHEQVRVPGSL